MATAALVALLLCICGFVQVKAQQRARQQVAAMPPDVQKRLRKRMLTVFLPIMGALLLAVFILAYFMGHHA